jgi:AbrB family looped-hinge helix DNA binding protein
MSKTRIVRQLRNGQITIPKEFREALHLGSEDMLAVTLQDGKLQIETVRPMPRGSGSQWAKDLYDLYAPVRQSYAESGMSEEEINAELDAAVRDARAEQAKRRGAS